MWRDRRINPACGGAGESTSQPVNLSTSQPLKIGLTGGIGSGKTTVARLFELLKVPVYYADAATKSLYLSDPELQAEIKKVFGEEIYANNSFDRKLLATKVFNDPSKLQQLNAMVHPRTIAHAGNWMKAQKSPYVIKEAALIFESGSAADLDLVIGVHAPEALRMHRTMKREGISREEVMKRSKQQIDEKIKMSLCDFVIVNDEVEAVVPQVLALHEKFLALVTREA
jgi:dephospho-CoA kinase